MGYQPPSKTPPPSNWNKLHFASARTFAYTKVFTVHDRAHKNSCTRVVVIHWSKKKFFFYNINFTRQITGKKAEIKRNKTRLNIQFRQTLSMDAALDI